MLLEHAVCGCEMEKSYWNYIEFWSSGSSLLLPSLNRRIIIFPPGESGTESRGEWRGQDKAAGHRDRVAEGQIQSKYKVQNKH